MKAPILREGSKSQSESALRLTSQCISILQYLLDSGMAQVISHGAFLLSYGVFY